MKVLDKICKVSSKVTELASYISFLGIIAIMIVIAVDVFLRKVFNQAIVGSYEIVQYTLLVVVFASFAYTQTKKMHVRVTLFLNIFPWRIHTLLNGLWELLCAGVAGVVGYSAFVQAAYLLKKNWASDVLRFPIAPFYYFEGILMFVFALAILVDAVRYFYAVTNKEYAEKTFKEYS